MGFSDPASIAHRERSIDAIHRALDAGVDVLDTSNIYAPSWDTMGHNEALVAEAVAGWSGDRSRVVIATKGGLVRGPGETWARDGSPSGLLAAARTSADVLGVDSIDLYYLHRLDPGLHFNDQVEALVGVLEAGVARQIGLSNINAAHLERALDLGAPIVAVQNEYSLRFREEERVLEICADRGIAFMPWSPLGGAATGSDTTGRYGVVAEIAAQVGATPQQVTLAWLLALRPVVIPIPGATKASSAVGSAAAVGVALTADQVDRISATVPEQSSVFPEDQPGPPM